MSSNIIQYPMLLVEKRKQSSNLWLVYLEGIRNFREEDNTVDTNIPCFIYLATLQGQVELLLYVFTNTDS